MADTTIKKVSSETAPEGDMGQRCLVSGKAIGMRLWQELPSHLQKPMTSRDYETVGYVIDGHAELELEGQTIRLDPGDSWLVPPDAKHRYVIRETFTAVEAVSPTAQPNNCAPYC